MSRIYVITCRKLVKTGVMSYAFMIRSNAPFEELAPISGRFGFIELIEKEAGELSPFRLIQGVSRGLGPDTNKKWNLHIVSGSQRKFYVSCDDSDDDLWLQNMLSETPDCVLLVERDLFDRLESACKEVQIQLGLFHYEGELATSYS